MGNSFFLGVLMCVLAVTSWGAMFPVMEHALRFMDPFYLTAIRYGIASILFLVILFFLEGRQAFATEGREISLWVFGTLGFAGFGFLVFKGQQEISGHDGVIIAAVITATMPLLAAFVTWYASGKKPASFTILMLVFAFIGVLLVVTKGDFSLLKSMGSRLFADTIILAGVFCWVFYTRGGNQFPDWSPLRYTALSCALGSLSIIGLTGVGTMIGWLHLPNEEQLYSVTWDLGYMILGAGILGVFAWNAGNRLLGSVNGVLFINLVPVVALGISFMTGEHVSSGEILGASLVITSLISNNLFQRPETQSFVFRLRKKINVFFR